MSLPSPLSTLPGTRRRDPGSPTALDGVLVVDFSRVIAGPLCTQMLADFGATVVKIEHPNGGDETRSFMHPEAGGNTSAFLAYNRGKRSIALDLTREDARRVAFELVDKADVLVENFLPGVMKRYGLDYETVSQTNPKLVYCSISAYGRTGPLAHQAGYDPVVQAETGVMAMNGYPEAAPVRTNLPFVDMSAGMMAAGTILSALFARWRSGKGQQVDIVLYDAAIMLTSYYGYNFLISGKDQMRYGHAPRGNAPIGLFHASDGPFYMSVGNNRLFTKLSEVLGRPQLREDPRFKSVKARVANKQELYDLLHETFVMDQCDNWIVKFKKAGIPAGKVRSLAEAYQSSEIVTRGLLSKVRHPQAGFVPNIAPPYQLGSTPIVDPKAPPLLGEHSSEILREVLGYDDMQIRELERSEALGARNRPAVE